MIIAIIMLTVYLNILSQIFKKESEKPCTMNTISQFFSGGPGYPAYGGAPTYNADYARMYSAFHGPPPAADPYMHRGYAPPAAHPPNYYPPFPHPPPPPYPNYSFLPPYPNPNMPADPQPPTQ